MTSSLEHHLTQHGITLTTVLSVKSKTLGARIRMHRIRLGMKQVELARLLGVAVATLSSLERADNGMSLERLASIISALGMSEEDFFEGEVEDEEAAMPVKHFVVRRVQQQKASPPVVVDHSACVPGGYLCEECAALMEAR